MIVRRRILPIFSLAVLLPACARKPVEVRPRLGTVQQAVDCAVQVASSFGLHEASRKVTAYDGGITFQDDRTNGTSPVEQPTTYVDVQVHRNGESVTVRAKSHAQSHRIVRSRDDRDVLSDNPTAAKNTLGNNAAEEIMERCPAVGE